jgi:predicted enzyme related to lactoylglutathione lyase
MQKESPMTNPAPGSLAWFEVATSDPDGVATFYGSGGQMPVHAVFYILVADVAATCADAEQLGGSVVSKHLDPGPGAPKFAYLRDSSGNQFGVFSPPTA